MPQEPVVVPAHDARADALRAEGWVVTARSFGAVLRAADADPVRLRSAVERVAGIVSVRELGPDDQPAMLALDAATLDDYPGGPATRHVPLTAGTARVPSAVRRAFGAFGAIDADASLVALTVVDVDADGRRAEVDFTVVHPAHRSRGLATAVKAASVRALLADGVATIRTGGSSGNAGILAAGTAIGFRVDEEWVTLDAPEPRDQGSRGSGRSGGEADPADQADRALREG
ncbi:acetyltransferase [Clavibacter sp. MX14-G9D]|uniref:acetyltransferase n=1 Tax=Clavibacter sp. MX14-G9D TaxID=3064656 RepID=UPI00293F46C8|nr:acetyltransferase [Clavibacter sp. MX14-G9D]